MQDYYTKTNAAVETFLEQIRRRNIKTNKTTIYRTIKKFKGCTKDDLIVRLKMPHQTVTARISDLMDLGLVEVSATKQIIGNEGFFYVSQFKIQEEPLNIKKNQYNRRLMRFKRLKKQLNQFTDIIPEDLLESINVL